MPTLCHTSVDFLLSDYPGWEVGARSDMGHDPHTAALFELGLLMILLKLNRCPGFKVTHDLGKVGSEYLTPNKR